MIDFILIYLHSNKRLNKTEESCIYLLIFLHIKWITHKKDTYMPDKILYNTVPIKNRIFEHNILHLKNGSMFEY